eukprot:scaffold4359_cov106-Isochrysis_galbana.AAC.3
MMTRGRYCCGGGVCLQLVAQVVVEVMCCADIVRKEGHSHLAAGRAVSRLATLITLFGLVVVVCVCKVRYKQATTRRVTRRVDVQREREFYLYGSTPSVDVFSSTQTAPQATAQWKKWLPALLRGLNALSQAPHDVAPDVRRRSVKG